MFSCVVATEVKAWSGDANWLGVTELWVTKLTGFLGGGLAEGAFTPANWVSAPRQQRAFPHAWGRITCLYHFPQAPQSKTILQYLLKVPNFDHILSIFAAKAELLFDLYTRYCPDRLLCENALWAKGTTAASHHQRAAPVSQYHCHTKCGSTQSRVCQCNSTPPIELLFTRHYWATLKYISIYQNFTFQTTPSYLDKKLNIRISVFSGHDAWLCCFFSLFPKNYRPFLLLGGLHPPEKIDLKCNVFSDMFAFCGQQSLIVS